MEEVTLNVHKYVNGRLVVKQCHLSLRVNEKGDVDLLVRPEGESTPYYAMVFWRTGNMTTVRHLPPNCGLSLDDEGRIEVDKGVGI